jgi:hypothetical protein
MHQVCSVIGRTVCGMVRVFFGRHRAMRCMVGVGRVVHGHCAMGGVIVGGGVLGRGIEG